MYYLKNGPESKDLKSIWRQIVNKYFLIIPKSITPFGIKPAKNSSAFTKIKANLNLDPLDLIFEKFAVFLQQNK